MKKILIISICLIISSVFGQFKYGFGVAADLGSTLVVEDVEIVPGISLMIPIRIGERFKIEPEISIISYNRTNDTTSVYKSIIMPGISVSYDLKTPSENTIISPGIKLGLIEGTLEEENSGTIVYTQVSGIFVAGILGGEYYFSKNYSLGGDFQLRFESVYMTKDPDKEDYLTQFSTRSSIKFRYYFN